MSGEYSATCSDGMHSAASYPQAPAVIPGGGECRLLRVFEAFVVVLKIHACVWGLALLKCPLLWMRYDSYQKPTIKGGI